MSSRHAQASLEIIAKTRKYEQQMRELGGATEKEIARHSKRYEAELVRSQQAAAREAEKAAAHTNDVWRKTQLAQIKGQKSVETAATTSAQNSALAWDIAAKNMVVAKATEWAKSAGMALFDMGRQSIEAADMLSDLSGDTGVSIEALDGLRYAAKLSGEEFEPLIGVVSKLQKQTLEFANGGGKAAVVFKELGISAQDTNGNLKSADTILQEVTAKLAGMSDKSRALGLAQKLAGEDGAKLLRVLNGRSLSEFTEAADMAGVSVRDLAAQADALESAWVALDLATDALGNQLAITFGPVVTDAIQGAAVWLNRFAAEVEYWKAVWNDTDDPALGFFEELEKVRTEADLKFFESANRMREERAALAAEFSKPLAAAGGGGRPAAEDQGLEIVVTDTTTARIAYLVDLTKQFRDATRDTLPEVTAYYEGLLRAVDMVGSGYETQEAKEHALAAIRAKYAQEYSDILNAQVAQQRETADAARAAQFSAASQIAGAFTDTAEAIGAAFDTTTAEGRAAARQFAKTAKALAAFDIAMKTAQAIAGGIASLSGGGPVAIALGSAAVVAAVLGAMSSAVKLANTEPNLHVGGSAPTPAYMPDERSYRLKRNEVVVDAQRSSRAGGAEGVRRRLDGDAPSTMYANIVLGDQIVDSIVTTVMRRAGLQPRAWAALRGT